MLVSESVSEVVSEQPRLDASGRSDSVHLVE